MLIAEGTEGVLSPHVTFIVRESEATGLKVSLLL
jgi:hypothetical protein